jgi:UDP-glucose 4-epimerase
MMRVAISGGTGYVGGRIAGHLLQVCEREVVIGTRDRRLHEARLPGASIAEMQWDSEESLRRFCRDADAVVHLAGMNAQECAADCVAALEVNGMNTARLVRAAASQGVRRLIYFSTAHVYSSPLRGCITERQCPVNLHSYATSHKAGEDAVRRAHESREIEGIVVRLSNSFGAPAYRGVNCWSLLVNDLCRQAVSQGHLRLNSAGTQRRDFITLTDVCRVVEHMLGLSTDRLGDGVYNVGGAWAPTVLEMAERIAACYFRSYGVRLPIRRSETNVSTRDETLDFRIDKLLATGYRLGGDIDGEIAATIEFCRDMMRQHDQ